VSGQSSLSSGDAGRRTEVTEDKAFAESTTAKVKATGCPANFTTSAARFYAQSRDRNRWEAGALGFVTKAEAMNHLEKAISKVLQGKIYASPDFGDLSRILLLLIFDKLRRSLPPCPQKAA
jgi:bisphosphoglycerate-independent phosphoglycerate mutase (AlkP superfamily)